MSPTLYQLSHHGAGKVAKKRRSYLTQASAQERLPTSANRGCIYCRYVRLKVKRWGNGMAVRLPRESPETGRLEEGMEVDVAVKVVKRVAARWKPAAFAWADGRTDLSVRHDDFLASPEPEPLGRD
jgi:antitoxin component of MazEF toxin-antitoxin module